MKSRPHAETPDSVRNQLLARLNEATAKWVAHGPMRYRLTVLAQCFCPGFMEKGTTIEFRGDSVLGIVGRFGRRRSSDDPRWHTFSVPRLLADVETAIRDLETVVEKLEFDPIYGVPTRLETNGVYGYTDTWFHQYISGFHPVP